MPCSTSFAVFLNEKQGEDLSKPAVVIMINKGCSLIPCADFNTSYIFEVFAAWYSSKITQLGFNPSNFEASAETILHMLSLYFVSFL